MTKSNAFFQILLFSAFFSLMGCGGKKPEENTAKEFASFSKAFSQEFQKKLAIENDYELISFFKLNRSQESITALVNILKNKDYNIKCNLDFDNAQFEEVEGENGLVYLPIRLVHNHYPDQEPDLFILKASFERNGEGFLITEIEGDLLHQRFTAFNNRNFWETEFAMEYEKRKGIYELVASLQSGVDSIIWFSKYRDRLYFYFTEGEWVNSKFSNRYKILDSIAKPTNYYKMGLLDDQGTVIIPAEFDLIGTLGFDTENLVEVKQNGKFGMYHLESMLPVIPVVYDVLIPYAGEKNIIIAQEGDRMGWFNSDFLYFEGLPPIPKIDEYLANYRYLDKGLVIQQGNQTMMEIPDKEYLGNGFLVPPSYLLNLHMMDSIEWGFMTTKRIFNASIEKKEFTGLSIQTIKEKFKALIVLVKAKYMDGREEFYQYNRLALIDETKKIKSVQNYSGSDLMSIRYLSDLGYFEGRTTNPYGLWEIDVPEFGIQDYYYFKIEEDGKFIGLTGSRAFEQTKFTKMDSSYLKGKFLVTIANDKTVETDFLSTQTIQYMIDEILAENGYLFPDPDREDLFYNSYENLKKNGLEKEPSLEKVVQNLSEIEKHNYEFLLGLLPKTIASR